MKVQIFAGIISQNALKVQIFAGIISQNQFCLQSVRLLQKKTFANYELNYFSIGFLHLLIFEPLSPKISNKHVHSRF